jgi:hypothetical protein
MELGRIGLKQIWANPKSAEFIVAVKLINYLFLGK